jgi:translation initiation factor IF-1
LISFKDKLLIINTFANMVKNVKGGSGHKSQARKFASTGVSKQTSKLRIVEEDGEVYAQVTKVFGNGMCDVLCIDEKTRLCIIRGKFRGRGKRDNTIRPGSWVLAGKREWESEKKDEKEKCDLLEVYSDFDIERLKKSVHENWKIFANMDIVKSKTDVDLEDTFEFSNSNADEYNRVMQTLEKAPNSKIALDVAAEDEEVWIDEI